MAQLHGNITTGKLSQPTVIVASKTTELSSQNEAYFQASCICSGTCQIHAASVDKTSHPRRVTATIQDLLIDGFTGVLFITHQSLSMLNARLLQGVHLIVDEVPQELIQYLSTQYKADNPADWEKHVTHSRSKQHKNQEVVLPAAGGTQPVQQLINDVRNGRDKNTTPQAADVLDFLVKGHATLYSSTYKNESYRIYQGICVDRLEKIVSEVDHFSILSAQLKDTVFGFVSQHLMGLGIKEVSSIDNIPLPLRHTKRARIIPFLSGQDRWSTTTKDKTASEALMCGGKSVTSGLSVGEYAQEFAETILRHQDFLIILNIKDDLISSLKRTGVVRRTSAVHGMNTFQALHHAVYLSTNIPTPEETKTYRRHMSDEGITLDIDRTMVTERCHEAAYQCIARTSVRDTSSNSVEEHIFIVPDMEYAEYIKDWFEVGYAWIDHTKSHRLKPKEGKHRTPVEWRQLVFDIMREHQVSQIPVSKICESWGVPKSSFYRQVEKFRPELEAAGLLPPKAKPA